MKDIVLPKVQKENGFTAIRIFCALIVVYEHFIILTGVNLPMFELRGIAVNVFFILSGFWVTRSLYTSKSLLEFYKKRVKKIFPAYLTVVFAAAILLVFISTLTIRQYFTDSGFWKYLVANISTLNFIHPSLPGVFNGEPVNGSLWTIKVELGFYIILPLIAFLCIGNVNNGGGEKQMCSYTFTDIHSFRRVCNFNTSISGKILSSFKYFKSASGFYELFCSRNVCLLFFRKATPPMELFSRTCCSVANSMSDNKKYLANGFFRTNCSDYRCNVACLKSKTAFYFCKNL